MLFMSGAVLARVCQSSRCEPEIIFIKGKSFALRRDLYVRVMISCTFGNVLARKTRKERIRFRLQVSPALSQWEPRDAIKNLAAHHRTNNHVILIGERRHADLHNRMLPHQLAESVCVQEEDNRRFKIYSSKSGLHSTGILPAAIESSSASTSGEVT